MTPILARLTDLEEAEPSEVDSRPVSFGVEEVSVVHAEQT